MSLRRDEVLAYHRGDRPGKVEIKPSKPLLGPRDLRLAYLPGATLPGALIAADPTAATDYTARANLVALITNGTSVPGLGDVGPLAAKPMQEGMAVLLKRLADIDVFDLELAAADPADFVRAVRALEPGFGAVALHYLQAPAGIAICEELSDTLGIPVFHLDLDGTAVVVVAALLNALDLTDKRLAEIRVVIAGAGTVGLGCARLLRAAGVPREHIRVWDVHGGLHPERADLTASQRELAHPEATVPLDDGIRGADVFIGASVPDVLTPDMVRSMARFPLVLALATPEPELPWAEVWGARRDVLVGTSDPESPNAVLDLLSVPYILRGALDVGATRITAGMKLAAARALASLAREDVIEEVSRAYGDQAFSFGPRYLLPKPIDPRILVQVSAAVARQAVADRVARTAVEEQTYRERLEVRLGTDRELMRQLMLRARQECPRVAFTEPTRETVLRAATLLADEGLARPVLLGSEAAISTAAERVGLDLSGVDVVDPDRCPRRPDYIEAYFALRGRRGVTRERARRRLSDPRYFGMLMLRERDADMVIAGPGRHYHESLRPVLEIVGKAPGVGRISSFTMAVRAKEVYFLADCAVSVDPSPRELAETALLAARSVRILGMEPRVAMLSWASFGASDHPQVRKVREAVALARKRSPSLQIEGEIRPDAALDAALRDRHYPFARLAGNANILVFPDLQSGNLAIHLLRHLGGVTTVGPVLLGTRYPVHALPFSATVEDIVNLTTIGAVAS